MEKKEKEKEEGKKMTMMMIEPPLRKKNGHTYTQKNGEEILTISRRLDIHI